MRIISGIAGGGAAAIGALGLVGAVALALGTGVYLFQLLTPAGLARLGTPGLEHEARLLVLWTPAGAAFVATILSGVLGLLLLGVGATAVVLVILLGVT